jgi:hypothetical protein
MSRACFSFQRSRRSRIVSLPAPNQVTSLRTSESGAVLSLNDRFFPVAAATSGTWESREIKQASSQQSAIDVTTDGYLTTPAQESSR